MAGRKPGPQGKPTALRVLHGDRSDRVNTSEPTPPEGDTEPLWDLDPVAQRVWDYYKPMLDRMGVMTTADVLLLAMLADQTATYRRARELLEQSDVLVKNDRGKLVRNPLVQVQRDAAYLIRMLAQEFGLSPASRADLTVEPRKADPRERFFA